jgi:drug/metabolite transporter (DMT)-like permease
MKPNFLPIALAILGGALYHISQKSIPKAVSPFFAIIVAYAVGIALCAIGLSLDAGRTSFFDSLKQTNWATIALGVSALLIEIGFLLAYRAGWNMSDASVVTNISVVLLLIPAGLIAFNESISMRSIAGIACCLLGLYLISKK